MMERQKRIPHHPFLDAFSAQIQHWAVLTLKWEMLAVGFDLFLDSS